MGLEVPWKLATSSKLCWILLLLFANLGWCMCASHAGWQHDRETGAQKPSDKCSPCRSGRRDNRGLRSFLLYSVCHKFTEGLKGKSHLFWFQSPHLLNGQIGPGIWFSLDTCFSNVFYPSSQSGFLLTYWTSSRSNVSQLFFHYHPLPQEYF